MSLSPDLRQKIEQLVASDSVVLFMKGNRSFPQCGFSASVVNILNTLVPKYTTVNILAEAGHFTPERLAAYQALVATAQPALCAALPKALRA